MLLSGRRVGAHDLTTGRTPLHRPQACGSCAYSKPYNASTPMDCAYISPKCWRPGGENHKGAVDFWRRKKQVFGAVQAVFRRHLLASTGIEEAEMREAEERMEKRAGRAERASD